MMQKKSQFYEGNMEDVYLKIEESGHIRFRELYRGIRALVERNFEDQWIGNTEPFRKVD